MSEPSLRRVRELEWAFAWRIPSGENWCPLGKNLCRELVSGPFHLTPFSGARIFKLRNEPEFEGQSNKPI